MNLLLMKAALRAKILVSIAITTPPTKTRYEVGEVFDPTGMVVTATYSDASTAEIALAALSFSPSGALGMEDTVITVSYNGKTVTQAITVYEEVILVSIAITTPPTKTRYEVGEVFDPTGMVVTATYSDSSTEVISNDELSFSPSGALGMEDTVITVSYNGKTVTQAITVYEEIEDSVTLRPGVEEDVVNKDEEAIWVGLDYAYIGWVDSQKNDQSYRFPNVPIPKNAEILEAHLRYIACEDREYPTMTRLYMNAVDDAIAPTTFAEFEALILTDIYVEWDMEPFEAEGEYFSPDIKSIVQSIVNRPGWSSGNAVQLVHLDMGSEYRRTVYGFAEGSTPEEKIPALIIRFKYQNP